MGCVQTFRTFCAKRLRSLVQCVFVVLMLLAFSAAQTLYTGTAPNSPANDLNKYPGLLPAFGELFQKVEQGVQFPARSQSRILPLLPQATVFYLGVPNVGDASNQAWAIFQKELQQSAVLQAWWQQGSMATSRTQIEDSWKRFSELSRYMGDEIVVSATDKGVDKPELLVIAEVRKPGLREFLEQWLKELPEKSAPDVHIIGPKELTSFEEKPGTQEFVILVRPDFVIGAMDVATLRRFNSQLDTNQREFASTEFAQKLTQIYQDGITGVGGIDLQKIVSQMPKNDKQSEATFERTGFSDVKYLIWKHKSVGNAGSSETELSFTGPRRGLAAWLGAPGPLGSLDFISPKTMVASAIRLNNPAQMFDDIKALAGPNSSKQFDGIEQMENAMQINLKDDLLGQLEGEITFDLDSVSQEDPQWKILLRVRDAEKLQTTLTRLLGLMPFKASESEEDGITYHALHIPSAKKSTEFDYAFVDGYLLVASSHREIAEAVLLHRNGGSLAKSPKFLAALPPEHGLKASALFYEDPASMTGMNLSMTGAVPNMRSFLAPPSLNSKPMVVCAYGEESAIRGVSRSAGVDTGAALVVAAIAIPNLLRARNAADESSALGIMRTIHTAQIAYVASYPDIGYARDIARLGRDPRDANATSAEHAGLIDNTLANASCAQGAWCIKSGFKFNVSATCAYGRCQDYVVTATPVSASAGSKSFCSTSQGVIHYKVGAALESPVSAAECRTWLPLH